MLEKLKGKQRQSDGGVLVLGDEALRWQYSRQE
jgi:predicted solute-binding protein